MSIRSISIEGFTSYREKTVVSDLADGLNSIVGRNGTGKSNFFAAIRWLLSGLDDVPMEQLIHAQGDSKEASVELLIDNSSRRFPNFGLEVRLKRVISMKPGGLRADEWFIEDKRVTRAQMSAVLEGAGFTGNSFFIVPQGQVSLLATTKPYERLAALSQSAGGNTFDKRKAAAEQLLISTTEQTEAAKRHQDHVRSRLKGLEAEVEDLSAYLDVWKAKRDASYVILTRERARIDAHLAEAEGVRRSSLAALMEAREQTRESENSVFCKQSEFDKLQSDVELLKEEMTAAERLLQQRELEEPPELVMFEGEYDDNTGAEASSGIIERVSGLESALLQIRNRISALKSDQITEDSLLEETRLKAARLKLPNAFSETRKRVHELQEALRQRNEVRDLAAEGISTIDTERREVIETLSDLKAQKASVGVEINHSQEAEKVARDRLSDAEAERSLHHLANRKATLGDSQKARAEEQATANLRRLTTVSGASIRGLRNVREAVSELGLDEKYYGLFVESLTYGRDVSVAVDRAAGQALFTHLVADVDTAETLLQEVSKRGGFAAFAPLSEISQSQFKSSISPPEPLVNLVDMVESSPETRPLLMSVLGSYVLCPSIIEAAKCADDLGKTGITIEGDIVEPGGGITGGYSGQYSGSTSAVSDLLTILRERADLSKEANSHARLANEAGRRVTAALNLVQQSSVDTQRLRGTLESISADILHYESELQRLDKDHQLQLESLKELDSAVENLQKSIEISSSNEITSTEAARLDAADRSIEAQRAILSLQQEEQRVSTQLSQAKEAKREHEKLKTQREIHRKQAETMARRSAEVDQVRARTREVRSRLSELRSKLEAKEEQLGSASDSLQDSQQAYRERTSSVTKAERILKKRDARLKALQELASTNAQDRQEIGQVSEAALSGMLHANLSDEALDTEVQRLAKELDKFEHVNKRAAEQYARYSSDLASLDMRQRQLNIEKERISDVIRQLAEQKEEKLSKALAAIADHFESLFPRLVEGGEGTLELNDAGIELKVRFPGIRQYQRNEALSGGQQTLCALALILAVQAWDPAPFYIFDEVDANLDSEYRTAVARMLADIASDTNTQVICTTHHEELVNAASKSFGVSFAGGESQIEQISTDLARKFCEASKA